MSTGDRRPSRAAARRSRRASPRPRRRVSVVGVLGELLITAGVFVLLFLGWQLWFNDIVVKSQTTELANELAGGWQDDALDVPEGEAPAPADIPVYTGAPANGENFALIYVPRFGPDYVRPIAQGTGTSSVLNRGLFGHYPSTQMPGEVGNFAIAAHRTSYGANLNQINQLQVGDRIYVETADGWYTYVYRNIEYVRPTGVGVLNPVPQIDGAAATERLLTMTSCNPLFSAAERIIAYAVFEEFTPRSAGAPAEIAPYAAGGT